MQNIAVPFHQKEVSATQYFCVPICINLRFPFFNLCKIVTFKHCDHVPDMKNNVESYSVKTLSFSRINYTFPYNYKVPGLFQDWESFSKFSRYSKSTEDVETLLKLLHPHAANTHHSPAGCTVGRFT